MADSFSILLMDKKCGVTSFESLYPVKRENRGKKVGHAGTLDKFASGLMVVLVGGATKLTPLFSSFDKEYIASIHFGAETDTLDPEGSVIATAPLPSEESLKSVIPGFLGRQMQTPPVYSAIHVDGKRAYKEARKGNDIEMPEREINIESLELLSFDGENAVIRTSVSKGTYIRSLARDIALRAGSRGYLTELRRLRVGPWSLSDSSLSSLELLKKTGIVSDVSLRLSEKKLVDNGTIRRSAILSDSNPDLPFSILYFDDSPYGVGEKRDGRFSVLSRL